MSIRGNRGRARRVQVPVTRRILVFATLALLFAALPTQAAPPSPAQEILRLTNEARARAGARPLSLDTGSLAAAALGHSRDMAARGYFAHEAPEPARRTVRERVRRAGGSETTLGENLYVGPVEPGVAASAVEGFMNSPGHRAAMLNPQYNVLGLGLAEHGGKVYVTEVFAWRPVELSLSGGILSGRVLEGPGSGVLMAGSSVVTRWKAGADGRFRVAVPQGKALRLGQAMEGNRYRVVAELPASW